MYFWQLLFTCLPSDWRSTTWPPINPSLPTAWATSATILTTTSPGRQASKQIEGLVSKASPARRAMARRTSYDSKACLSPIVIIHAGQIIVIKEKA